MITLNGITLPDLYIEDEFQTTGNRSVVEFSSSGVPIIWQDSAKEKPMTLVGGNDFGVISRSTLLQLYALAETKGGVFELSYEGTVYDVRFAIEAPPVIDAEPILPRPNAAGEDIYKNVTIKLMVKL